MSIESIYIHGNWISLLVFFRLMRAGTKVHANVKDNVIFDL